MSQNLELLTSSPAQKGPDGGAPRKASRRILIVDDDSLDRRILRDLLAQSALTEYSVAEARTPEDALLALGDTEFDACLVDFYLDQECRGTELIAMSMHKGYSTPFIVLTGSISPEIDRIALDAGAVDFLAKDELTSSSLDRSIRFACRQAELLAKMTEQAAHDQLTGLANRREITRGIEERLSELGRTGSGVVAVLYLDLDGFKRVNDTMGHAAGDLELKRVAGLIRSASRSHDLVGRHGGDEFVIAARFDDDGIGALRVAERICATVNDREGSHEQAIGVSIGVATTTDADADAQELLWQADLAMYEAKDAGRRRVSLYDEALRDALTQRITLEQDFLEALDSGALKQVYQPLFSMKDQTVLGFEALARWDHPSRGSIDPTQFVALAAECGASKRLTNWTLRTACQTLVSVREQLPSQHLSMSINICIDDLGSGALYDSILSTTKELGVDPSHLNVEIAEAAAIASDDTIKELNSLVELGVGVAIDDFGTGFSSITKIHELPLTGLKLDRSFVDALDQPGIPEVVATIGALAKSLGIEAIAEGVETEYQLDHLSEVGFTQGQGFLVSCALPSDKLIKFLKPE